MYGYNSEELYLEMNIIYVLKEGNLPLTTVWKAKKKNSDTERQYFMISLICVSYSIQYAIIKTRVGSL